MGGKVLIDIIGSTIIGGFLLFMVLNLNGTVQRTVFSTGNDLSVQENLVNIVSMIEHDFRRLGWCYDQTKIPDPTKSIISATRNSIKFVTDVNSDGNLDTLEYKFDSTQVAGQTANPHDRMLYRTLNRVVQPLYVGMTQFDFKFLDALSDSIPFPIVSAQGIYEMQLSITLESPSAYDTTYSYAYWRQLRLTSRNLKNR
jgi:hypothetical protein